jgi:sialidase-1
MKNIIQQILIAFILFSGCSETIEKTTVSVLWEKGVGKYNNYRIPSVIITTKGTVLAICEGREAGDSGNIDLLLKRSNDNGKTWSGETVIWDDKQNTCGNPCPVVDEETGRIWLFATWNSGEDDETEIINRKSKFPRVPYLCYSDDDGKTWSEPVDMSETCRDTTWGWYATGPGVGIQIKNGKYKGRLVIPANHSYNDPNGSIRNGPYGYGAHVIFSDDRGKTWSISGSINPGCNESQVVELTDGRLLMNMRSYNNKYSRAVSISDDGGETWSPIVHDPQLVESKCQASILSYGVHEGRELFMFSNPAVPFGRNHISIKTSFDNCDTWSNNKLIYSEPAAYSCLTKLPNGNIGLFFEAGKRNPYDKMVFVSLPVDELFTPGTLLSKENFNEMF